MDGTATNETVARPTLSRRGRLWIGLLFVYTLIAVLMTGYRYLDDLTRQIPGTFPRRALEEGTGAYSVFLLFPFVFLFSQRYLFERKGWLRLGLLHVAGPLLSSPRPTP